METITKTASKTSTRTKVIATVAVIALGAAAAILPSLSAAPSVYLTTGTVSASTNTEIISFFVDTPLSDVTWSSINLTLSGTCAFKDAPAELYNIDGGAVLGTAKISSGVAQNISGPTTGIKILKKTRQRYGLRMDTSNCQPSSTINARINSITTAEKISFKGFPLAGTGLTVVRGINLPSKPTDLSASLSAPVDAVAATTPAGVVPTPNTVYLSWSGSSSELAPITSWEVERASRLSGATLDYKLIGTIPSSTTSQIPPSRYSDSTGTSGNTYYYRTRAVNIAGNSDYSNESYITLPPAIPASPLGLLAKPSTVAVSGTSQINGVRLDWTLPGDQDSSLTYSIQKYIGDNTPLNIANGTISAITWTTVKTDLNYSTSSFVDIFPVTSVITGKTINYRLSAANASGKSQPAEVTITLSKTPNTPTNLKATLTRTAANPNNVVLNWTSGDSTIAGATPPTSNVIYVERGIAKDIASNVVFVKIGESNVTSFPDSETVARTTYVYRVKAVNTAGSSAYSNIATITTPTPAPTDTVPPTITKLTPFGTTVPVDTKATITFSEPIDTATIVVSTSLNTATITLQVVTGTSLGTPIAGSVSLSTDKKIVTFTPTAKLLPGANYKFSGRGAIKDLAGNKMVSGIDVNFTTVATPVAFDFTVNPSPSTANVTPAIPASTLPASVIVTKTSGTAAFVTLSAKASNDSISLAITKNSAGTTGCSPLDIQCSAALNVTVPATLAAGNYTVTVTGTSGAAGTAAYITHSGVYTLTVTKPVATPTIDLSRAATSPTGLYVPSKTTEVIRFNLKSNNTDMTGLSSVNVSLEGACTWANSSFELWEGQVKLREGNFTSSSFNITDVTTGISSGTTKTYSVKINTLGCEKSSTLKSSVNKIVTVGNFTVNILPPEVWPLTGNQLFQ